MSLDMDRAQLLQNAAGQGDESDLAQLPGLATPRPRDLDEAPPSLGQAKARQPRKVRLDLSNTHKYGSEHSSSLEPVHEENDGENVIKSPAMLKPFPKTPVVTFDPDAIREAPITPRFDRKPSSTPIKDAYSSELRFWTVWRVLGVMFVGITLSVLLAILSLVAVSISSWSESSIGVMNLSIMTVICALLMLTMVFSMVRWWIDRAQEKTMEQHWVVVLAFVCWIQPYLNPIALGFRWSAVSKNITGIEAERGYTIHSARISGFSSTLLITALYAFCFYEIRRFRDEEFPRKTILLLSYFALRMSFTQATAMDLGSVPVAPLFSLFRLAPVLPKINSIIAARIAGIVITSVVDLVVWISSWVYHRNTRAKIMQRLHDENDRGRAVQYGLSVVTTVLWTTQMFLACVIILCTAPSKLQIEDLSFVGTSVNTVGCCSAFLLVTWMLSLSFAHFPIKSTDTSKGSKQYIRSDIRVRFFTFEKDVPQWAVLIVNGRRINPPTLQRSVDPVLPGERNSSVALSADANVAQSRSLKGKAKDLLTNSINTVGEAIAPDGSQLILDPGAKGGTAVNFILDQACTCLNFANIAYNTGNYDKPQTNAQVQMLVEDSSFKVHRQVSSTDLDVHAVVFVSKQRIIVSFRGTHSTKNMRTDAAFNWKAHMPSLDWAYAARSAWARRFTPKVHAGFRRAYGSIRLPLLSCLEELLAEDPSRSCWLCGHSMGGSLACLFAFDARKKLISDPSKITVFTYGSSRLGNESFRVRYNDAVPQTFCLFYAGDPVTKLPPRFPFGLPLGYKHHGIPIMLLPNGEMFVRPSRAEVAVLHSYAPSDWGSHRIRAYAQALMKWCVLKGVDQELRPFWNSIVTQVHCLPHNQLMNPHLLRYLLQEDKDVIREVPKSDIVQVLNDALVKRPFVSPSSKIPPLELFLSISGIRLPLSRSTPPSSTRSPFPHTRRQVLAELRAMRSRTHFGHADGSNAAGQQAGDPATIARIQLQPSDMIHAVVSCGTADGEDAVDAPEHVTWEVPRGTNSWALGMDQTISFGGAVQTLRPELDELTFRIYRRATECSCETGLLAKLSRLPSAASFAIHNNNQGSKASGLTLDVHSSSVCDTCATPVCIAQTKIAVSSFFSDLASVPEKELVLPAMPTQGVGLGENAIIKVRVWDSRMGQAPPEYPESPVKSDTDVLRTYNTLPCYDASSLLSGPAYALFPEGFLVRLRVVKALGAPYMALKSPIYRLRQALAGGIACKIRMPNTGEKFIPTVESKSRDPIITPELISSGFGQSFSTTAAKLMPNASGLLDSAPTGVSTQRVLEVRFKSEIYTFGVKQTLSGLEEVVVRLRSANGKSKLWLNRTELGGYAVCELHSLLKQSASEIRASPNLALATKPLVVAKWYPLRGPGACGKVLVAFEFIPKDFVSEMPPSPLAQVGEFPEAEEAEDGPSGPYLSSPLRQLPRLTSANSSSARVSRFSLELLLCGLRYLPVEFERVAVTVEVRDEYNPRNALKTRTEWIEHSGVVQGWMMQPQRMAMGFDPATSLEGSEEIVLRIVDTNDAVIAKRSLSIRDLLAEFAETESSKVNSGNGEKGPLVSLLAWFVIPYKIAAVRSSTRAPEVKVLMRIADADRKQSNQFPSGIDGVSLV